MFFPCGFFNDIHGSRVFSSKVRYIHASGSIKDVHYLYPDEKKFHSNNARVTNFRTVSAI